MRVLALYDADSTDGVKGQLFERAGARFSRLSFLFSLLLFLVTEMDGSPLLVTSGHHKAWYQTRENS